MPTGDEGSSHGVPKTDWPAGYADMCQHFGLDPDGAEGQRMLREANEAGMTFLRPQFTPETQARLEQLCKQLGIAVDSDDGRRLHVSLALGADIRISESGEF